MRLLVFFLVASLARAQTASALLSPTDANNLAARISQLMESTAAVLPGLIQTGNILIQNAKGDAAALKGSENSGPLTLELLTHARAYLALTDTMPKPYPMPETAHKQFVELREDIDRFASHFQALLNAKERQLVSPDRDNLGRYAEANANLGAASSRNSRVVFLGASIIDFWRLNEYFTGREYVNRGIGGQITGQMLGRFKTDVLDLHPKAVLILGGANDIARGVSPQTTENNFSAMADLCRANGIRPVFASLTPVSDYHKAEDPRFEMTKTRPPATIVAINNWLRDYCAAHRYIYVDFYNALKDTNGAFGADLSDDGLHPNAKGYRIMAPIAIKALDQALSETSPEEQPAGKKKRAIPSVQ